MDRPVEVVEHGGGAFTIVGVNDSESHKQQRTMLGVHLQDGRGVGGMMVFSPSMLLTIADVIYRHFGREPRDQPIRVELVDKRGGDIPSASPCPLTREFCESNCPDRSHCRQQRAAQPGETEAIKAYMLRGGS